MTVSKKTGKEAASSIDSHFLSITEMSDPNRVDPFMGVTGAPAYEAMNKVMFWKKSSLRVVFLGPDGGAISSIALEFMG